MQVRNLMFVAVVTAFVSVGLTLVFKSDVIYAYVIGLGVLFVSNIMTIKKTPHIHRAYLRINIAILYLVVSVLVYLVQALEYLPTTLSDGMLLIIVLFSIVYIGLSKYQLRQVQEDSNEK